MDLISSLQQKNSLTLNGMVTNSSSLKRVVDLFFSIGSMRSSDESSVVREFSLAFNESPEEALKILFWARDIREGAGERRVFRLCTSYLADNHPVTISKNLKFIPEYGRWDDLLNFEGTKVEVKAFDLIKDALYSGNKLCAKWMPRKGKVANSLRKHLKLTPKEYRKLLVENTEVVEQKMCSKKFNEIEYSKIPSLAAARYQASFKKNDSERYDEYIAELIKSPEERTVKINAGAVYPYDVIRSLSKGVFEVANEQWKSLPNYLEGSNDMILPLVDVSGSMETKVNGSGNLTCMDVAVSLGLYISERNEGPFKDCFITFSERPKLEKVSGSLKERYEQMSSSEWGMNTNLEKVFTVILDQANKNEVPDEAMPSKILIVSDMEFDMAISKDKSLSAMEMIRSKYEESGYKLPSIIFWNVRSREGNVPVRFNELGTALISGFSPSIMKSVLGGKEITPLSIMYETINSPRYEAIKA